MKRFLINLTAVVSLLNAVVACASGQPNWIIHHLNDLNSDASPSFIDKSTISAAFYDQSSAFDLKPSVYDRVVFILKGNGNIKINQGEKSKASQGDVLFLRANESLQFLQGHQLMTWSSKSKKTDHQVQSRLFTAKEIQSLRNAMENVWNPFIQSATMITGLYMLPISLGGDDTLLHQWDEINYVLNGTAKFKMNDTVVEVKPGSVMWVKRGIGHYFYDLSEDFDVFILFETVNMDHEH